jgi:hypothetical protein
MRRRTLRKAVDQYAEAVPDHNLAEIARITRRFVTGVNTRRTIIV